MVTELCKAHAPTSGFTLMSNFCVLHKIAMKQGEAIESYFSRIRDTVTLLRGGKIELHQILIILCAIRGLA